MQNIDKLQKKAKSLAEARPDLCTEWHPQKNGTLTPEEISCWSKQKVWWLLRYYDPETEKDYEFEWQATVEHRYLGSGCPFLTGKKVYKGFNDLATKAPEIAKQWHPVKNGSLTPYDVTARSGKKVWWILPYDDPETGEHFDFEWEATVDKRVAGRNCPFLTGKRVWPGFNDFKSKAPQLARQWHSAKNEKSASETLAYSNKKVWWIFPYDDPITGEHFDFEWDASPASRLLNPGCPFISGQRLWKGYNDLATRNPKLAKQWHYERNGDLTPNDIMANSRNKVWWVLSSDDPETGKHFEFEWPAKVCDRNTGDGCPFLSNQDVWPGFNDLMTKAPDIAKEWHPTKNRLLKPDEVTCKSGKKVWWLCSICGREFRMSISHRTHDGSGCNCIK